MPINSANRRTLLCRSELASARGTLVAPSGTTDTLLATEVKNPVQIETEDLTAQNLRNSYTPFIDGTGRQLFSFAPKTFLMTAAKAGTATAAGTPPFISPLLQACGLKETVSASSVTYTMQSDPNDTTFLKSMSTYFYAQELLHIMKGVFGTVTIDSSAGQFPTATWDMKGLLVAQPSPVTLPVFSYPTDNREKSELEQWVIASYSPVVRSWSLKLGVVVPENRDCNASDGLKSLEIMGRRPMLDMVLAVDNTASQIAGGLWNPYTDLDQQIVRNISMTHGSATNKFINITIPQAQIRVNKYDERDNFTLWSVSFLATHTSDDQELTIVFK